MGKGNEGRHIGNLNTHSFVKEVLRILGVESLSNSPQASTMSNGYPSQVQHTSSQTELDRNCLSDILMKELAVSKTKTTELSNELERKRQDLKQALQREAAILRELQIAKDCIVSLEDKVRQPPYTHEGATIQGATIHTQGAPYTHTHLHTYMHVQVSCLKSLLSRNDTAALACCHITCTLHTEAMPTRW